MKTGMATEGTEHTERRVASGNQGIRNRGAWPLPEFLSFRFIPAMLVLLLAAGGAWGQSYVTTIDSCYPDQPLKPLVMLQAAAPRLDVYTRECGVAYTNLTGHSCVFRYGTGAVANAFVTLTNTSLSASGGYFRYDFPAAKLNTNGVFWFTLLWTNLTGNVIYSGRGRLTIEATTATGSAGELDLTTPLNLDVYDITGTLAAARVGVGINSNQIDAATDAAYRAGGGSGGGESFNATLAIGNTTTNSAVFTNTAAATRVGPGWIRLVDVAQGITNEIGNDGGDININMAPGKGIYSDAGVLALSVGYFEGDGRNLTNLTYLDTFQTITTRGRTTTNNVMLLRNDQASTPADGYSRIFQFEVGNGFSSWSTNGIRGRGDGSDYLERVGTDGITGYKLWDIGTDGAGSGLDADLLDGNSSAYYLSAATAASTYQPLDADLTKLALNDASSLTNLNASNLASGTVPIARLSGVTSNQIDATTDAAYRSGSGVEADTWQTVMNRGSTAQVSSATLTVAGNGTGTLNIKSTGTVERTIFRVNGDGNENVLYLGGSNSQGIVVIDGQGLLHASPEYKGFYVINSVDGNILFSARDPTGALFGDSVNELAYMQWVNDDPFGYHDSVGKTYHLLLFDRTHGGNEWAFGFSPTNQLGYVYNTASNLLVQTFGVAESGTWAGFGHLWVNGYVEAGRQFIINGTNGTSVTGAGGQLTTAGLFTGTRAALSNEMAAVALAQGFTTSAGSSEWTWLLATTLVANTPSVQINCGAGAYDEIEIWGYTMGDYPSATPSDFLAFYLNGDQSAIYDLQRQQTAEAGTTWTITSTTATSGFRSFHYARGTSSATNALLHFRGAIQTGNGGAKWPTYWIDTFGQRTNATPVLLMHQGSYRGGIIVTGITAKCVTSTNLYLGSKIYARGRVWGP